MSGPTLSVLAHTCNPSLWETEAGDHHLEASLGYKVRLQKKTLLGVLLS